jgi:hypothetical protein
LLQKNKIPLFELKKLNFTKLDFSPESLIDSLVRYSKRQYKARCKNDAINLVSPITDNGIPWQAKQKVAHIGRNIDL